MKNKLYLILIIIILLANSKILFAQLPAEVNLPDFSIGSVSFNPEPKEGKPLGVVKILVHNKGTADAPQAEVRFDCLAVDCDDDRDCLQISQALKGVAIVPPIRKGSRTEVELALNPSLKWVKGTFIISAIIDPEDKIREASEANNFNQSVVYLKQFAPEVK